MSTQAEKSIDNRIEKLGELVEWLTNRMEEHKVDSSPAYKLRLAMEEIATNAVYYGFPTGTSGTVTVRLTVNPVKPEYILEILDDGEAFNPLKEAPEPDIELSLEDREMGGLGVFLVQNLSEDCNYQRVNGWNHLTITVVE